MHLIRHILARQIGQRLGRGDLHRLVDRAGTHVQRATEDVGEPQHVVDLIGIVAASGRDDRVRAGFPRLLRRDLRIRIRHREDDRLVRHAANHVLGHRALHRQTEEYVGTIQRIGQRARLGGRRMRRLPLVHALGASLVDHALGVAQHDVLRPHAHRLQQLDARNPRRSRAVHHQLRVTQFPPGQMARIDQPGRRDNGCPVLVIVEHRDVHQLPQPLLDHEAFGRLDVLQVDAAKPREIPHGIDHIVDILRVDLQVDPVDIGEALEQRDLAFHHRLRSHRAKVTQPQHRGAVGHHRDHVALGRVVVRQRGIALDVQARAPPPPASKPATGRAPW